MIDLDTLPQETGLMTMQNDVLPATDDEIYVTPSDTLPDGPILPARIGPASEPAGPAVRPRVLDTFLTWLATHDPTVSALLSWQGTTLVLADTDEQRPPQHITPGPDGRYSLAA